MESATFESEIRKCKRFQQTVNGFKILFFTELPFEQSKARAGILIYSNAEFKGKDLNIVSEIYEQVSKRLLTKSVDIIF